MCVCVFYWLAKFSFTTTFYFDRFNTFLLIIYEYYYYAVPMTLPTYAPMKCKKNFETIINDFNSKYIMSRMGDVLNFIAYTSIYTNYYVYFSGYQLIRLTVNPFSQQKL